jgi:hypothetical protein
MFNEQIMPPINEKRRLDALVTNWRGLPIPELKQRCAALNAANKQTRLSTYVYKQWLLMSAIVTVSEIGY